MTQDQKVIKNKFGLLKLAQTLGTVSEAAKVMGYSGTASIALSSCTNTYRNGA